MPIISLNKRVVSEVRCPENKKRVEFIDTDVSGFYLEVRESGGRTFYIRYTNAYGKRKNYKIGSAKDISLAQAKHKAALIRSQAVLGDDPSEVRKTLRNSPTLRELYESHYLSHIKKGKKSWKNERGWYENHILPVLGSKNVNEISPADINAFVGQKKDEGLSNGTICLFIRSLKALFNMAITSLELKGLSANPAAKITQPKCNVVERYLNSAEVSRLLQVLSQSESPMLKHIVIMLLATGARKREVLDSKWREFDLDRRTWVISKTKSGKPRTIVLNDTAIEILKHLKRKSCSDYAFANPATTRPYSNINYQWQWVREKAGLEDVRIHDLRHSFASFLINDGRSLYEVQKILGHSSPRMTERYAHLQHGTLLSAVQTVDSVIQSTGIKGV